MSEATIFIPPHALNTAVLFLVFNRLDTTKQVFEAIRQAKPPRLYVAADGARANKEGEADKTQAVRDYIMQNIDWKCEVKTLFREENLGCKYAVSGAITWFFENEEMGIILEDDCLPSQSFFWFCETLLEKYKNDERIGIISGSYYFFNYKDRDESYYFSAVPFIWGWASWKRVWNKYDVHMKKYVDFKKQKKIESLFYTKNAIKYWENSYDATYAGNINTWDYQFSFSVISNNLINIIPTQNLISNIGFGEDATHTSSAVHQHSNMKKHDVDFPLIHPIKIERSKELDIKFEKEAFKSTNIIKKILNRMFK